MNETSGSVNPGFWKKHKTVVITVSVTLLIVFVLIGVVALGFLKYYVGGGSISRRAIDAPLRSILWEPPALLDGPLNQVRNNRDASISVDGRMIVLAREFSENNYDLYISRNVDDVWSPPLPIEEINSPYNEKGPELSHCGRFLFFSSDRPGGFGGYDIWYSYREGNRWSRPVNMGDKINSASNEKDPSLSPDSKYFFFSSDRPFAHDRHKNDYDIYMATAPATERQDSKAELIPKPPDFETPTNLVVLNSLHEEGKAVLTPGGHTIYFSSNRPGGLGGYDLYRSYFIEGEFQAPTNFGTPVNSPFDEINPTMTLEGFGIYFSSNRRSRNPNDFHVFRSTSREVLMKFDYALLGRMILTFLGILAGILLVYLLLRILLSDTRMKLIWKCLLAAVVMHLLGMIICAFWFLSSEIAGKLHPAPKEMTINVNNLARESIAMAIRESVASLPNLQTTAVAQRMPVPSQKPVSERSTPTQPSSVPKTSVTPVRMETVQDVSGEPPKGEPAPVIEPFSAAGTNITMESPPGQAAGDDAAPAAGKFSDGMPKPFQELARPEMPKIQLNSVPIDMDVLRISDPVQTAMVKSDIAPPAADRALRHSDRFVDTPDTRDPADQIMLAAGMSPVMSVPGSLGILMIDQNIRLDENRIQEMRDSPELTLLANDPNIAKAVDLVLKRDKIAEQELEILVRDFIQKRNLPFNSFEIVRFLVAEMQLKPVGGMVYDNLGGFQLPVDSELDVPEKYLK